MFPFDVLGGMCGENSCNVFMMLFMILWVPNSAALRKRAVLILWRAFLFFGLRAMGWFPLNFFVKTFGFFV
jgi:hypothetical protein